MDLGCAFLATPQKVAVVCLWTILRIKGLKQWFSMESSRPCLPPAGHLAISGDGFGHYNQEEVVPLESCACEAVLL